MKDKQKNEEKPSSSQNNLSRFRDSCPLQKKELPEGICELGLTRARWTADHVGYLPFEEKNAPGCPFGMLTGDKHSYCFFKFMEDLDRPLTEEEISKLLCLTRDQVRKIIDSAAHKIKASAEVKEMENLHSTGHLFNDLDIDEDIYYPDQFNADSVQSDGVVEDPVPNEKK